MTGSSLRPLADGIARLTDIVAALTRALLVPAVLAINALAPWLITALPMLGGTDLYFQGTQELGRSLQHKQ